MVKTILKEGIIVLLLCVAILIVLSVLFYDYNPLSKVVPNKIAYTTPENIKNQLEEESIENTLGIQNKVYTIEGSDLNIYKKSNTYNPSKQNPFATTSAADTNVGDTSNGSQVNTNTQKGNVAQNSQTSSNNGSEVKNTSGNKNTGLK